MRIKKLRAAILCIMLSAMATLSFGCGKAEDTPSTEKTASDTATMDDAEPVTEAEQEKDESGFYMTDDCVETVGDTINVRVEPSTTANIYVLLEAGKVLKRTGYNNEWTRVKLDGTEFYIYSDYVRETDKTVAEDVQSPEDEDTSEEEELVKKVVIDPCNQGYINASEEIIGPNASKSKLGCSVGDVGVALGTKESELNLSYAKAVKSELERRGFEVVLTRDTNDIDITNKARADIANSSEASAFIRIQAGSSSNDALMGIMAITITKDSPYNSELYDESHNLATRILQGAIKATNASNQGIFETSDMTGMNWSRIPVATIQIGYLSNETEEANLVSEEYMEKLVEGIADGIEYYFED